MKNTIFGNPSRKELLWNLEESRNACDIYIQEIIHLRKVINDQQAAVKDVSLKIKVYQSEKEAEIIALNTALVNYQDCLDAIIEAYPTEDNIKALIDKYVEKNENASVRYAN